jgi:hypothetical protein
MKKIIEAFNMVMFFGFFTLWAIIPFIIMGVLLILIGLIIFLVYRKLRK